MFYDRFEELCKQNGISVSRAAAESGVNKSSVTYWKNNPNSKPTGQSAIKLCKYFGITMNELYGDVEGADKQASTHPTVVLDDFTYAMHGASGKLSEKDKKILLDMANQLAAAKELRDKHEDSK